VLMMVKVMMTEKINNLLTAENATIVEEQKTSVPSTSSFQPKKCSWNKGASLALISLYREMKLKFDSPHFKNSAVWQKRDIHSQQIKWKEDGKHCRQ